MGYVDDIMIDFEGKLSPEQIYAMTYKEIGYLRKHRLKINQRKSKTDAANLKALK